MTPNPTDQGVAALVERLLEHVSRAPTSFHWIATDLREVVTALSTLAAERGREVEAAYLRGFKTGEAAEREASEARATALEAELKDLKALREGDYQDYKEALERADLAEAQLARAREALEVAEPYVELAHSTAQAKDVRTMVWKRLKQVREALRSTPPVDGRGDQMLASARCPQEPTSAEHIADAVLTWMVKYDLLDAGNEYNAADVLAVLNDLAPDDGPGKVEEIFNRYASDGDWDPSTIEALRRDVLAVLAGAPDGK